MEYREKYRKKNIFLHKKILYIYNRYYIDINIDYNIRFF